MRRSARHAAPQAVTEVPAPLPIAPAIGPPDRAHIVGAAQTRATLCSRTSSRSLPPAVAWLRGPAQPWQAARGAPRVHPATPAHGVALARILNRTLVLPHMWCYCDKYWHRLEQCATPNAAMAQPLLLPMDHVVDPRCGTARRVSARRGRCVACRQLGGRPVAGRRAPRAQLAAPVGSYPHIRMSSATLATSRVSDDVPRSNSSKSLMTPQLLAPMRSGSDALRKSAEARLLTHEFVPGTEGPRISLEPRQTDATLRKALGVYDHARPTWRWVTRAPAALL